MSLNSDVNDSVDQIHSDDDSYSFSHENIVKDQEEALDGFNVPKFKKSKVSQFYDYENVICDYETMMDLNSAINKAREALFVLTDYINEVERRERTYKLRWERAHRRAYMVSSEKTEGKKKAHADLVCEDLEDMYIKWEQAKNELTRDSVAIKLELQTMQILANNIRQQLKL